MYEIILLPALAGLTAQLIKFFVNSNNLKINLSNLAAYSGMPSGHSAMMFSLSTIVGLTEGFDSALFAVTFVMTVLIIRDAVGLRQYLGQHGKTLNLLVKDLDEDKMLDNTYPHLLEKIGHTPLQVFVGSIIGISISLIGFYLIN
ncbi:divergent PAP2 family protein [Candidatus Parcubacteria bacterium]|nr:divergent PAP2 family protein [Patescibacteria group bacterium]MBU4309182.1 divergent PAP2 family protein [Patescibacteria group bacterium]MBU4432525.1 divergent PAP2 family protein [Patescibacteria group bacterium]MBU4577543.1 divergent PAP2 family protein [Patescibacteria group bacterium]MCG2697230.1 divergent PAP2 family protein [Candidatus Parcubacteria bacterium]